MGCCGCSNKSSAITAGILGLIQAFIGLVLNSYFLNLYLTSPLQTYLNDKLTPKLLSGNVSPMDLVDEKVFLIFATRDVADGVKILLVVALCLHCVWIISSISLLIGNANNSVCCVRQWVIVTSFIIIGDMILPVALIGLTMGAFMDTVRLTSVKLNHENSLVGSAESVISSVGLDLYKYYIILLISFFKLSLITIITNICLNVFTNRRATEISCPRGYVMGPTVTIIQGHSTNPNMVQVGPGPGGVVFMAQPQSPYNPTAHRMPAEISPGNIPLQPATSFPPDYRSHVAPDSICNDLNEPLIITK